MNWLRSVWQWIVALGALIVGAVLMRRKEDLGRAISNEDDDVQEDDDDHHYDPRHHHNLNHNEITVAILGKVTLNPIC